MERRLAAILAADVVGYTRLMGADEAGTLRHLTELRQKVLEPLIAEHRGRVVKLMGDGLLVEFASVVDAVACAVTWQKGVVERETESDDNIRFQFRIGINIGDIIVEGDDIHGDGVNIAARLEGQAEPGGICLSGDAYRQAKGKIEAEFEDLGEQNLKNVAEPVRIYRIAGDRSGTDAASLERAPLALPDKPSIAVLPFTNMSGDPEQIHFSEGLAEDIITALSRFRWLTVISPRSSFKFHASGERDLDHIATELRVQYLLDGSIRRSGQRLRVVARLTETQIGKTEWSEKFDFSEGDIFELQDELSQRIVSAVAPASLGAEMERAQRRSPENPETWIEVMRAHSHLRRLTQPDNIEAQSILVAAFDRRPGIAMLASDLAISHVYDALFGWSVSRRKSNELADKFARQAILIDRNDALAYTALGFAAHTNCAHEDSVNAFNTALRLNENLAEAHGYLAMTLGFVGEVRQVEYHVDRAIQLSPYDPMLAFWFDAAAMAAYMARQFELALDWANRSVAENPDYIGGLRVLAAACGQLGRTKKANSTVAKILTLDPTLTCDATTRQLPFRSTGEADLYAQGLRVAGLP